MSTTRKPVALIILDGWGVEKTDSSAFNSAKAPVWNGLWENAPRSLIATSGLDVGLPEGQMGNSEVGHMNIGAGRVVYQNLTRITREIENGDFFKNEVLVSNIDAAVKAGKAVHILGLMSDGGVHSHQEHMAAACQLAADRGADKIYVHAFLDGRDTPPRSAEGSISFMEDALKKVGKGRIASICGRYYAMDRDNRWERVETAYNVIAQGEAEYSAKSAQEGLSAAYERDENDEFVKATVITDSEGNAAAVADGDTLICMNFRPDRAREITRPFIEGESFDGFTRKATPNVQYVMLTEYSSSFDIPCAYPPETLHNTLGEYLADNGKTQLRIAETEKYAHVTFFFSGGQEDKWTGEERILVPSPKVATYDLQPEMSAPEVTDKLCEAIRAGKYDFICCNYANGDMVGHSGDYDAAVKAVEAVDSCLGKVLEALREVGGEALITADHGNVEMMQDPKTGQAHTSHTVFPVGLVYDGPRDVTLDKGILADLAPTVLNLMGMEVPKEMSGKSLVHIK
ncbi:2,3-bisphosphoglycerate-independent phosphoglycerate mutase [Pokkaliibacter sp. CJK22405]|uniref:2,3-bisphosphoglycerate-independent phosphoglycerate mutase n=1 Tax=Pokkaliibacter sp. CJK22405 TaxID=3384615 RepID=UPI00398518DD